ncbi:HprK-related kinase B [Desulfonema limicola]|uniref:HprK-related kinase B n=1 Tax=Desulfonema limicola TaxID=45656 RepID=A0A975BDR1_9BACT|nr:HprK-related kinase B [Desulfonema limicola]QTA83566.1 HprK-related kinase B [Desulfonema limicola]
MILNKTCHELIENLRKEYVPEHKIHLSFGNCLIEVSASSLKIIDKLKEYFKDFDQISSKNHADIIITFHEAQAPQFEETFEIKKPDPGKTKIKEEFLDIDECRIVRKRLTGMIFIFGKGEHLGIGPCLDNMNQVVNFINNRFIEWELCRGCLLGHAAGIVWNRRGLAIAGFSGAGKSTLALHIMNLGATFLSNDRLMIEKNKNGLIMHGVAKLPRINPGTILNNPNLISLLSKEEKERFSILPLKDLWELEHKYDAPIDQCFGPNRFVLNAPMNALAILNWEKVDEEMTVRQVNLQEKPGLLPAFMKSTGLFFTPHNGCCMPEPSIDNYIKFLSRCSVLEFSGGINFEKAARTCLSFLDTGEL